MLNRSATRDGLSPDTMMYSIGSSNCPRIVVVVGGRVVVVVVTSSLTTYEVGWMGATVGDTAASSVAHPTPSTATASATGAARASRLIM